MVKSKSQLRKKRTNRFKTLGRSAGDQTKKYKFYAAPSEATSSDSPSVLPGSSPGSALSTDAALSYATTSSTSATPAFPHSKPPTYRERLKKQLRAEIEIEQKQNLEDNAELQKFLATRNPVASITWKKLVGPPSAGGLAFLSAGALGLGVFLGLYMMYPDHFPGDNPVASLNRYALLNPPSQGKVFRAVLFSVLVVPIVSEFARFAIMRSLLRLLPVYFTILSIPTASHLLFRAPKSDFQTDMKMFISGLMYSTMLVYFQTLWVPVFAHCAINGLSVFLSLNDFIDKCEEIHAEKQMVF